MDKILVSLYRLKELIQTEHLSIIKVSSEVKPNFVGIIEREGISCKDFIDKMLFKKFLHEMCSGIPVDVSYEISGSNTLRIEVGNICTCMDTVFWADCVFQGITVDELEKKLEITKEDFWEEFRQEKWW